MGQLPWDEVTHKWRSAGVSNHDSQLHWRGAVSLRKPFHCPCPALGTAHAQHTMPSHAATHAPCADLNQVPRARHLPVLNQQLRRLAGGARLPQCLHQLAGPQGGQLPWKRAGVGCIPPPPSTLPPLLLPCCLIGVPLLQAGKGRHSLHAVGSRESGGRDGCSAHGHGRTEERAGVSALGT